MVIKIAYPNRYHCLSFNLLRHATIIPSHDAFPVTAPVNNTRTQTLQLHFILAAIISAEFSELQNSHCWKGTVLEKLCLRTLEVFFCYLASFLCGFLPGHVIHKELGKQLLRTQGAFCSTKKFRKFRNRDNWYGNFLGMFPENPEIVEFSKREQLN